MALTQVNSGGIATGAVTATQIAANAVTVDDISDGSISTAKLADDSVTGDKLANTAVTAGTYGSSSAIPSITVDAQGRITSASTNAINIDSTSISNGTSNVSIASSGGNITATRGGSTKLTVTSTGIDVTGEVTCDGLTSDGNIEVRSGFGSLYVKDSNNTGTASQSQVAYQTSDNTVLGQVGYIDSANSSLYVRNAVSGYGVIFETSGATRCQVNANGHFTPNLNNTYDIGTSSLRWRNIYTNDLNLSNEGGSNDVDGTWGSWTIQEGEDDLFLLNRRNGKKYKFNLTEVS